VSRIADVVSGAAMADGRLPVHTQDDLDRGLLALPRIPHPEAGLSHLGRRAQALGLDTEGLVAAGWSAADVLKDAAGYRLEVGGRVEVHEANTVVASGVLVAVGPTECTLHQTGLTSGRLTVPVEKLHANPADDEVADALLASALRTFGHVPQGVLETYAAMRGLD